MVAGRDSYQDFQYGYTQLTTKVIAIVCYFKTWTGNGLLWMVYASNLHKVKLALCTFTKGILNSERTVCPFIFPPKLPSRDQQVSSILRSHKQAFIKQQKVWDSLWGRVITKLWTSLAANKFGRAPLVHFPIVQCQDTGYWSHVLSGG